MVLNMDYGFLPVSESTDWSDCGYLSVQFYIRIRNYMLPADRPQSDQKARLLAEQDRSSKSRVRLSQKIRPL